VNNLVVENLSISGITHDSTVGLPGTSTPEEMVEFRSVGAIFEGSQGGTITNLDLSGIIGANGTSVGACCAYWSGTHGADAMGLIIVESEALIFEGVSIQTVTGGGGGTGTLYGGSGGTAGEAHGLVLKGSGNTTLSDLTITTVTGGPDSGGAYKGHAAPAGRAVGIRITECTGTTLDGFAVTDVQGGQANHGPAGQDWKSHAKDGTAVWVEAACSDTTLTHGEIAHIYGGECTANWNLGGRAWGLRLDDSSGFTVTGLVIRELFAGIAGGGNDQYSTHALALDQVENASLSHLTMYGIWTGSVAAGDPGSSAIWMGENQSQPVLISNSIFSQVEGVALSGASPDVAGKIFVSNSLFHLCDVVTNDATLGSGVTEGIPGFVDDEGGDLHLKPSSGALDAGKDGSDYCAEPEPNGCAANLGAYGNTAEATSAIGVDHCPCPDDAP
jgi:hypothetical protein